MEPIHPISPITKLTGRGNLNFESYIEGKYKQSKIAVFDQSFCQITHVILYKGTTDQNWSSFVVFYFVILVGHFFPASVLFLYMNTAYGSASIY